MGKPRMYDHEAILKDWLNGMSAPEIAAKYGCASNMGVVIAKRHGVKRSPEVARQARIRGAQRNAEKYRQSPTGKQFQERHQQIAEHAKRHGIKSAAAQFGINESSAHAIATRYGWKPNPQFDREAILREYLAGATLKELAAKYGCNPCYPSSLAIQAGVKRDPRLAKRGRPRKK